MAVSGGGLTVPHIALFLLLAVDIVGKWEWRSSGHQMVMLVERELRDRSEVRSSGGIWAPSGNAMQEIVRRTHRQW